MKLFIAFHSLLTVFNLFGVAVGAVANSWLLVVWCAFWGYYSLYQITKKLGG